mmetsp:Transcript_41195/g.124518  ORF Transcript_41195/g.124518 Transcript_41195/m.124518 type:complete len:250 (+) Transcript_41195:425-1174(+)
MLANPLLNALRTMGLRAPPPTTNTASNSNGFIFPSSNTRMIKDEKADARSFAGGIFFDSAPAAAYSSDRDRTRSFISASRTSAPIPASKCRGRMRSSTVKYGTFTWTRFFPPESSITAPLAASCRRWRAMASFTSDAARTAKKSLATTFTSASISASPPSEGRRRHSKTSASPSCLAFSLDDGATRDAEVTVPPTSNTMTVPPAPAPAPRFPAPPGRIPNVLAPATAATGSGTNAAADGGEDNPPTASE